MPERDLLEEAITNTRAILREFQALPHWQRFSTLTPEVAAMAEALRKTGEPPQVLLGGLSGLGGLTAKSE